MRKLISVMPLTFLFAAVLFFLSAQAEAQLAWNATQYFQYNFGNITLNPTTRVVTIEFWVSNPQDPSALPYDLFAVGSPFKIAGARLAIDIGWPSLEYTNIGSRGSLATVPWGGGVAAALPISVNALTSSTVAVGGNHYNVFATLPSWASGTGTAAIEGHPMWWNGTANLSVPVKSQVTYFPITTSTEVRRQVVDITKCQVCHNDVKKDKVGVPIPRLSMHGANRNENTQLCPVCHNPNQTDIAYRTAGAEVAIDFKRLVHSIHASSFRKTPFTVIGRNGVLFDFSHTAFPQEIRNCVLCHVDSGTKGTFELPLKSYVTGSTIETLSVPGVSVDVDPANDYRITPIAAVCSACHDDKDKIAHMISKGASFHIQQKYITATMEKCPTCHGPGKTRDVRKVHQIGGD